MKRILGAILSVVVGLALAGCASFPFEEGIDPATDTTTLAHISCNMYKEFITIVAIDDVKYFDSFNAIGARDIYIKPGNRKLKFQYQNRNTGGVLDMNYEFVAGKRYQAFSEVSGNMFTVEIKEIE
jgi:hypothetical protein